MKLSRKMKFALGLSLGAIATTAAVTTMAVSCSDSSSDNSASNYNPSPALSGKISKANVERMNTNMQNNAKDSEQGLIASGATDVVATGSVVLQGDKLIQTTKSSFTQGGVKKTNDLIVTYTLVKNAEGKYLVETKASVTENGVAKPTPGTQPTQYVTKDALTSMIQNIYN